MSPTSRDAAPPARPGTAVPRTGIARPGRPDRPVAGGPPEHWDALVVGGGIAGLTAAWELTRAGLRPMLVEARGYTGGLVAAGTIGGVRMDLGAEGFAVRGRAVTSMVDALGLRVAGPKGGGARLFLPPRLDEARSTAAPSRGWRLHRFIRDALLGIPAHPLADDVVAVIGRRAAERAARDADMAGEVGTRPDDPADLASFVRTRMGEGVLDRLTGPIVAGIHSSDPAVLAADALAPGLREDTARLGSLQAAVDSIKEDKAYMDKLANIAATFMTQFNDQHRAGAGIDKDKTSNLNFFGRNDKYYIWDKERQSLLAAKVTGTASTTAGSPPVTTHTTTLSTTAGDTEELQGLEIIKAMKVSAELVTQNGELKVAARGFGDNSDAKNSYVQNLSYSNSTIPPNITGTGTVVHTTSDMNGTADGSNAVLLTNIFNMEQKDTGLTIYKNPTAGSPTETRPTGTVSLNNYYNSVTSALGIDSNAMDTKVKFQQDVMTQIEAWRTSVSGVNWNEELSNMIKFQQGYSACARCMTTMDEMLDRLVNNTGLVGR